MHILPHRTFFFILVKAQACANGDSRPQQEQEEKEEEKWEEADEEKGRWRSREI